MNDKYQDLIYQSEGEKSAVEQKCLQYIRDEYSSLTEDEIISELNSVTANEIQYDYIQFKAQIEGEKLFKLVSQKYGNPLWSKDIIETSICYRSCPFGEMCNKEIISIHMKEWCYGQLLFRNLSEKEIIKMIAEGADIKLLNERKEVIIDTTVQYDPQILSSWFDKYRWFIQWFGDGTNERSINGYALISAL